MLVEPEIEIRVATPEDDILIAQQFYQLWLDNNVAPSSLQPNWEEITLEFIDRARQDLNYRAFLAEVEGRAIASISCQLFAGLYPGVLSADYRKYGYIWNVFVEESYRNRGIATQLMQVTIDYLKSLNCTKIILHATPMGKPVYERLEFVSSNEMSLNFQ